jgi:SAM domain (Sterile alpha motif)
MNVRVWLRGLGLGRYEEKFRENKIDFDVLADLTDGDLEELGVSVGDRRRLLRAIAEFGGTATANDPSPIDAGRAHPSAILRAVGFRRATADHSDVLRSWLAAPATNDNSMKIALEVTPLEMKGAKLRRTAIQPERSPEAQFCI